MVATLDEAQRSASVIRWRSQGKTNRWIAQHLGLSESRCSQIYKEALSLIATDGAEDARKVETEHLMELRRKALAILARTHVVVNQGHIVGKNTRPYRDADGRVLTDDKGHVQWDPDGFIPLEDDDPALRAIAQLVRISESYRKLHGYDAPQKLEIHDDSAIDAEIQLMLDDVIARLNPASTTSQGSP